MTNYVLRVRDSGLNIVGEVDDYADFQGVVRFNAVGSWLMTLRDTSPAIPLLALGGGIVLVREGTVLLSGPIRHWERRGGMTKQLVLGGPDDMCWLQDRLALPVVTFPYSAWTQALSPTPQVYWRLSEPSGSTATDVMGNVNGTYAGVTTYNAAALVDDASAIKGALLAASTGTVRGNSQPAGMGTGNTAKAIRSVFQIAANPAGTIVLGMYGSSITGGKCLFIQMDSSGRISAGNATVGTANSAAVALNTPHVAWALYDGAGTIACYLDGVAVGTVAGTLSLNATGNSPVVNGDPADTSFRGEVVCQDCAWFASNMSGAQILSDWNIARSRYAYSQYDTRTGTGSTILRQYVDKNAGPGARSDRVNPLITLAADPAVGSSVTGNARFDPLMTPDGSGLLQTLARQAGDLGFNLVQSGTSLVFSVYQPSDKSATQKFSEALGNLADFSYAIDGPTANMVYVGGGGDGTARVIRETSDATSISTYRRIEQFLDRRDSSDTAVLDAAASDMVTTSKISTNLSITPVDTPSRTYATDYGLGDKVTVVIDAGTITDVVREVGLNLSTPDNDVITPSIGNPASGQVVDLADRLRDQVRDVQARLARLEGRK
jgi:hypothetical protein